MTVSLALALDFYGVTFIDGKREQKVRCPVHADRDPSMNVNLDEGVWYCHACGKGGNALTLIMEKEGCDRGTARTVAADNGLNVGDEPEGGRQLCDQPLVGGRSAQVSRNQRGRGRYVPPWRRGRS